MGDEVDQAAWFVGTSMTSMPLESDISDNLRQLILAFQPAPSLRGGDNQLDTSIKGLFARAECF
jgi:hypothetical protein